MIQNADQARIQLCKHLNIEDDGSRLHPLISDGRAWVFTLDGTTESYIVYKDGAILKWPVAYD